MHNACMQARYNHMNHAHTHHPSRTRPGCYVVYMYTCLVSCSRTSRRDHMYKTRCYTRIETRSRRTWFSSRLMLHCYYTDISSSCQVGISSRFISSHNSIYVFS